MREITKMRERGAFIVFEGLDGCGKTTQLHLLSEKLTQLNQSHITTHEPSETNPVGRLTREVVRHLHTLEEETMALLFAADRYQHVKIEIKPALQAGKHVLCDRYYYSNFAYQGIGKDDDTAFERLAAYNMQVMTALVPDLTFFIDVEPEECLRRINFRRTNTDRYENLQTLVSVQTRFREVFTRLRKTDNIAVIDAQNLSETEIASQIWERVESEVFFAY